MAESKEKLFTEFPPVTTEAWMEKVTADLKGADFNKKLVWKTNEGFSVKPMYRAEDIENLKITDSLPGQYPFVRGTRTNNEWQVQQNIDVENLQESNTYIQTILTKGVTSLGLNLTHTTISSENIQTLLEGIDPTNCEIHFICQQQDVASLFKILSKYYQSKKFDLSKVVGSVNCDPFGEMMSTAKDLDYLKIIESTLKASQSLPKYRTLTVNSILFNNAGAFIAQELGYALAWGNSLLELATDHGFSIDEVANKLQFNMGISSNYFMEIAKFRAARYLWAQIVSQYNPKDGNAAKMWVNAETSRFNMTIYDANVNMLRSQTEAMSAALAGVDSITVTPYDVSYKNSDEFSDRIARNQQLLLKEESHLNRIVDPAAGSYYIENLTMAIAQEAWKLFLEVQDNGGFVANTLNGSIQEKVNASAEKRGDLAAKRREILVGTNQYPNFTEKAEQKIEKKDTETTPTPETKYTTLNTKRLAEDFEAVRLQTEKATKRPKVFMLTIGNLAMRLARAQFSCNFFACAGYEIFDNLGFNSVEEGVKAALDKNADIIVLCSSDDEYPEYAPQAQQAIGDKSILVIAGAPACMDDLKAMGIHNYINVRSNVLETLKTFNEKLLK